MNRLVHLAGSDPRNAKGGLLLPSRGASKVVQSDLRSRWPLANMYRQNRATRTVSADFAPIRSEIGGARDVDPGSSRNVAPTGRSKNRASPLHQRRHMRGHRARQGVEVVAAFQHRDDAAAAVPLSDFHQAPRHPGIVRLDEIEVTEGIEAVGIEARRDDDEIRREVGDARQDRDFHRLAEGFASVAGATNAFLTLRVITSSTANIAPPAERRAASNEPGDIVVDGRVPLPWRRSADRFDIVERMDARDRRKLGTRRDV